LLAGVVAQGNVTVLLATHKSALLPLCQRLLIVHGGKVIMDGPRAAVLAKLAEKAEKAEKAVPAQSGAVSA
ncbi:MAG: hypothetical protein HQL66_06685, partial [Magnetococcales bacterium]|nr:hypothetical protein [Magnetococcales bacterium]